MSILDTHKIRSKFPYFKAQKNNHLIYFDNAATTQKPECVINAVTNFYINENSNIHRSVHKTGAIATQKYEDTTRKEPPNLPTLDPQNELAKVIEALNHHPRLIVVEFNGIILPPNKWQYQHVQDGDTLEIVTIVGGGSYS